MTTSHKKQWQIADQAPADFLSGQTEWSSLLRQLLFNRGLLTKEQAEVFLSGKLPTDQVLDICGDSDLLFYNPFLFRDMEEASSLIIKHIKQGSKIVVYGDYDADGVTSAAVLMDTLKILKAQVEVYLPDRVSEGYGLNKGALDQLATAGAALIITVDSGIRNKEEVAYAQSLGLDVIITDHHVLPEEPSDLPECPHINPSDKTDAYPWPYLAGVGVAFKLASALVHKADLPLTQKKLILEKSLDLVAVGTIADMVSLLNENRMLASQGLKILNQGKRLGLAELIKVSRGSSKCLAAWNVSWQLAPRLNAASRLAHANTAFALLTTEDETEAKKLATELNERNLERQQITEDIIAQVEMQIDADNLPPIIIGVAPEGSAWNEGVVGLVAGRICEKYYRPTLVISRLVDESGQVSFKGSGRSIAELNLIAALTEQSQYLAKFGGHPMACGFSVADEDTLNIFKTQLTDFVAQELAGKELLPKLKIEAVLNLSDIDLKLVESLQSLAPFGQDNPQPKLVSYQLKISDLTYLGQDNQHLKLRLTDGKSSRHFCALAFSVAENYHHLKVGDLIDLVYNLDINEFNGRREAQLRVIDLKLSETE